MYDAEFTPPPSEKQLRYARLVAARLSHVIPWEAQQDRAALSKWISDREQLRYIILSNAFKIICGIERLTGRKYTGCTYQQDDSTQIAFYHVGHFR